MPRIEVDAGQLTAGSGTQAALAAHLLEAQSRIQGACATAAAAAGDGGAAAAISEAGAVWAQSLAGVAAATAGLARNLGAAADAYTSTDQRAMPAGGGG